MKSGLSWSESLRLHGAPEAAAAPAHDLAPRRMADSYCELLRFGGAPALLEAYTNTSDGICTGNLMEHLDSLAGSIAYKHLLRPVERIAAPAALGFYLVKASVNRLDMLAYMSPVAVRMEALNSDGSEETVMLGRFCMVCRDSKTHKAHPVNPIVLETAEDQQLWRMREACPRSCPFACSLHA
ncbi:hypothetical protein PsYK624_005570 [Phanerochaete sordida]|uniref:Uncharacterized protein n=1 Tax=Phanerochaete sordida TaxID=48140 RepID=A0A9P3FXQ0_9APHY|nr:hypothetical protein PsYK624_005570 [Phanerochaete sordida]